MREQYTDQTIFRKNVNNLKTKQYIVRRVLTRKRYRGIIRTSKGGELQMSIFEGFTTFNFSEGVPFVSITRNGITFNKGVVLKMECPKNVVLLVNAMSKQIAIQACPDGTPKSAPFYNDEKKSNALSVRWNGKDLLNTITTITGWDLSKGGYKAEGHLIPEEKAMLFDLNQAEPLE